MNVAERFGTYGVTQDQTAETLLARRKEELLVRGFTVLEDVISHEEVAELNAVMDRVYDEQCDEVGGEDQLLRMNDADIVRALLAYDDAYMQLALNKDMIELAQAVLGENIVLIMQNGIINRPERVQFQTRWHRDLNYQHWTISQPIAVSALVSLEDFNLLTGGTVFLPGSHKFPNFPSDHIAKTFAEAPVVPKGSIIMFDSMVFHRAGVNRSNLIRRGVNHVFGAPILSQQVDLPAMLDREPPADPWQAGFLGYRWSPVQNVAAWRRRKIEAAG